MLGQGSTVWSSCSQWQVGLTASEAREGENVEWFIVGFKKTRPSSVFLSERQTDRQTNRRSEL